MSVETKRAVLLRTTERAFKFRIADANDIDAFWVPRSLFDQNRDEPADMDEGMEVGDVGYLSLPDWKAEEVGL